MMSNCLVDEIAVIWKLQMVHLLPKPIPAGGSARSKGAFLSLFVPFFLWLLPSEIRSWLALPGTTAGLSWAQLTSAPEDMVKAAVAG